jgi:hypothetical protein
VGLDFILNVFHRCSKHALNTNNNNPNAELFYNISEGADNPIPELVYHIYMFANYCYVTNLPRRNVFSKSLTRRNVA